MDQQRQPHLPATPVRRSRRPLRRLLLLAVVGALLGSATGASAVDEMEAIGEVVVEHGDDFVGRRAPEVRYLETGRGRFLLQGAGAENLMGGVRVRVRGKRQGATLVVGAGSSVTTLGTSSTGALAPTSLTASAAAPIPKRVAVLLINFTSPTPSPSPSPTPAPSPSPSASPTASPTPTPSPSPSPSPTPTPSPPPEPWTRAFVRGLYFTNQKSVASYFAEVSDGRLAMAGDVFGYYTLAVSTRTCDYADWGAAARRAATAAGVDLTGYTNVVHAFPKQASCPWGGLGQVPGRYTWINGSMSLYVTSHELGHNFGGHHATTLRCTQAGTRVVLSTNCSVDEYGDPFDVMGTSAQRHVHSWHRRQLGFLGTTDQLTVTQSGRYTIATAEVAGGTPRIVRIPRPQGDYFYLEFRQPFGLYDNFATTSPAVTGVMIRIAPDVKRVQSRLLDMTPATTSFGDAALAVGQTFTDASGISVTTLSVGPSGASVQIKLGPDVVPPSAPPGFVAETALPSDVRLSWNPSSDDVGVTGYRLSRDGVTLGTTPTTSWTDTNLVQGRTYAYSVAALDAALNASAPATLSHHLPDTTPPSAPPSASASQTGPRSVAVTWQASADNVGVTGYEVRRNGQALATTSTTGIADASLADGFAYAYDVRAIDAAGNLGPPTSVQIALPDVTPPTAAGSVTVAATSATSTRVTWSAATDNVGVTAYRITRDGASVATLPPEATAFVDTGLASDRTYQYSVVALDAAGNVGPAISGRVQVLSPDTVAPSVPTNLRGESLGRRRIGLSWRASTDNRPGTISYRVFRNDRLVATVTTTSYVDRPDVVGWYSYKVRAVDAAGNRSAFTPSIRVKAVRYV